jgi:hypothetical protein
LLRCTNILMLVFVSSVLALPQGWCSLLLSLGCCKTECKPADVAEAPKQCCCSYSSCYETEESPCEKPRRPCTPDDCSGECILCSISVVKPPVKTTGEDCFPSFVYSLHLSSNVLTPSAGIELPLLPPGTGPPLHVRLCVWRC